MESEANVTGLPPEDRAAGRTENDCLSCRALFVALATLGFAILNTVVIQLLTALGGNKIVCVLRPRAASSDPCQHTDHPFGALSSAEGWQEQSLEPGTLVGDQKRDAKWLSLCNGDGTTRSLWKRKIKSGEKKQSGGRESLRATGDRNTESPAPSWKRDVGGKHKRYRDGWCDLIFWNPDIPTSKLTVSRRN